MSKQLNFFIHPSDLAPIFDFFKDNSIKYVNEKINDINGIVLHDFPYKGENPYSGIFLISEQFGDRLYYSHDEERHCYVLDIMKSYVLKFSPSMFFASTDKIIYRGRFYCETDYLLVIARALLNQKNLKAGLLKFSACSKSNF